MKTWLITGCSSGIGRGIAKAVLKKGDNAVVTARDTSKIADLVDQYPNTALGVALDITKKESISAAVKQAQERFGTIDVLINNAGVSDSKHFYSYEDADFDRVMNINLRSVFLMSKAAAEVMKKQKKGVILNTSSMVSIYGQPAGVAYPTSKFAVNGMTKSLARELGKDGIRVNAVAPGIIATDMVKALDPNMISAMAKGVPVQRLGEPEDIANAFLF